MNFCDAKQTHADYGAAKAAVRSAGKRKTETATLRVYRCSRCRRWHLSRAEKEGAHCAKPRR